jgi:hypothetical protein
MAKEVWVFGTKEQVFTQAYKIENSWTIKHYLIDSGRGFFTLPLSCKFLKPLTSLLRHRLMSFLCQKLFHLRVLFVSLTTKS